MDTQHDARSAKRISRNGNMFSNMFHSIFLDKSLQEIRQELILWGVGPGAGIIITVVCKSAGFSDTLNAVLSFSAMFVGFMLTTQLTILKIRKDLSSDISENMSKIELSVKSIDKRIDQEVNKVINRQSQLFEIHSISMREADKKMNLSCERAQIIKNTYVHLHSIVGLRSEAGKQAVQMYERFLSRSAENRWIDITSIEDFLSGRYQTISLDNSAIAGDHTIYLLHDSIPIINYAIFGSHENELDEVYFGWVSSPTSRVEIYYSTNKKIVSLFNAHFQMLEKISNSKKIVVDYRKPNSERFKHINTFRYSGYWVSMSGSMNANRVEDVKNASIIFMYYYEGRWRLKGYIFKLSDYAVYERLYAEKCAVVGDGMNYTYEKVDMRTEGRKHGFGMYKLNRDPIDAATGFYIDNDNSKKMKTVARRVYDERSRKLFEAVFERITNNDSYDDLIGNVKEVVEIAIRNMVREGTARKLERQHRQNLAAAEKEGGTSPNSIADAD